MKIYTSYFANLKKVYAANIAPIGIARFSPKYFYGNNLLTLAPRADMLSMEQDRYDREYKKILSQLNPHVIYKRIEEIAEGRDVALLCYEKFGEHCHRHLVAEWLNKELGLDITEFGYSARKIQEVIQMSLF